MGPWAISGRCCSAPGSSSTRAPRTTPARTVCGRSSRATRSPISASRRPSSARSWRTARTPSEPRPRLAAGPRLDRGAVEPRAVVVVLPRGRRRPLPIINYSGGTEVTGGIVSGNLLTPIKPTAFSGPMHRHGGGRRRRRRATAPRRGGRAGDPGAAARHDPRLLARSRALRGDVLVALPGDLGARRLGAHRCRRPLVHPRPLGRHAQDRGQAGRARGGRVRGGRSSGGPGGGRDRRPARNQRRSGGGHGGPAPRRERRRGAAGRHQCPDRGGAR